jgi:hypothetical protein
MEWFERKSAERFVEQHAIKNHRLKDHKCAAGHERLCQMQMSYDKYNGTCGNGMMIRQDRLGKQLLGGTGDRILKPVAIDRLFALCEDQLRKRLTEMQIQGLIANVDSAMSLISRRQRLQFRFGSCCPPSIIHRRWVR